jgi:KaiC/GvpD/RAD55 family RecA-like ATPase
MPEVHYFYYKLLVRGEVTAIFAPTNAGKTVFTYQVADSIAREGYRTLYVDCEMSLQNLKTRYLDSETGHKHIFSSNLERAELAPELLGGDNPQEVIYKSIEDAAKAGFQVIVVDNISFLCADMEKGATAGALMAKICGLRKEYGLTIIIVAHTPKRKGDEPLTSYSMFGSSMLAAFFDAIIAIGISNTDPTIRYVKTCKFRSGPYPYPAEWVALYRIEQVDGFLQFNYVGRGVEADHLKAKFVDNDPNLEEMEQVVLLKEQNKSLRAIAKELGISLGKVQRRDNKAQKLGLTADFFRQRKEAAVSDVSASAEATSTDTPPQEPVQALLNLEDLPE